MLISRVVMVSVAVVVVGSVATILRISVVLVVLLVGGSVGHIGRTMSNIPGVLVQKSSGLAFSHISNPSNSWKFLGIPISLVSRGEIRISSMAVAEVARSIDNITIVVSVSTVGSISIVGSVSIVGSISIVLGISIVVIVLVSKSRVPKVAVMVSINSISVQAVRVDKVTVVVGYFASLVEAGTISMAIGTFLSIPMSIRRGFQAVVEGRHSSVGRLDLVEIVGPLGVVEVTDHIPGGRVGGLHLHGPSRGDFVASLK